MFARDERARCASGAYEDEGWLAVRQKGRAGAAGYLEVCVCAGAVSLENDSRRAQDETLRRGERMSMRAEEGGGAEADADLSMSCDSE